MAKLKPWYHEIPPREDLRENRPMDASEFAVHLDHIREKRSTVSKDYLEPGRFFERTYLTASLIDLASQVVRRLSGEIVETNAVFNMATQFGGGKTHALATLFHLAKQGEKARPFKGVLDILQRAKVKIVPGADVAVFVGTEFDVLNGRTGKGEPHRKTPWGEIAWQLGGERGFKAVAEHDAKGICPAGEALRGMLPDGPTLILMDELLNYVGRARKAGMRDQFYAFLLNLSEEARSRRNLVLCVSIPASELEMTQEDERDHEALKKLLDRLGKAIMMSSGGEISEIIRRRLFEWKGMPAAGPEAAREFAEWCIGQGQALPGVNRDAIYKQFEDAYPFHPSVLSVFERKWQSLPKFQRTRGILRLLALWVANAYQEEHRKTSGAPLITLGSAPLDDVTFRAALFEQLGSSQLEVPVMADIVGKPDSHAGRLDREATEEIRKAGLHRSVATTIFFESNGGMSQNKAEAAAPEIRFGVGTPGLNLANVDAVLDGLLNTCFYLNGDRGRYRFGLTPNLNQILVTRRAAVQVKEIDKRVREEIETVFKAGPKELDRKYFVQRSNDIPNRPQLTLVVMDLAHQAGDATTAALMEMLCKECGGSGRTYKSSLIFAAAQSDQAIKDAARSLIAWEAIDDDDETKKTLDDTQKTALAKGLKRGSSDLREAIWRAYNQLFLLDSDQKLRLMDLGQITSSMAESLTDLYMNELSRTDVVTKTVGANKLIKYWPPALTEWSTKAVRDAFYSSPTLPRLLNGDSLRRTIADGVTAGQIGYATKDAKGRLKLDRFLKAMNETEVDFGDDTFILKPDDARRLLEPPRLAQISISPSGVNLRVGATQAFSASGLDQYGKAMDVAAGDVQWGSTGGQISRDGVFTAGADEGAYCVTAAVKGVVSEISGRISKDKISTAPEPGKRLIRWSGEVPALKWSNFYMKVLAKLANSKDLKLNVSLEVSVEREQADSKVSDVKSGLKDLGLSSEIRVD